LTFKTLLVVAVGITATDDAAAAPNAAGVTGIHFLFFIFRLTSFVIFVRRS
jgi:hypothetical protein